MEPTGWWLLPRTRVGQIGVGLAGAAGVLAVFAAGTGLALSLVVLVATSIVWTAIVRHGDATIVLWLLGIAGLGWVLLTVFG